jgi:hypothetical protein
MALQSLGSFAPPSPLSLRITHPGIPGRPIMFAHTAVTLLISLTAARTAQAHSHAIRQDPHAVPPLAEITQGMPVEPAVPLSATPTAGSPPVISGAPNLPQSKSVHDFPDTTPTDGENFNSPRHVVVSPGWTNDSH